MYYKIENKNCEVYRKLHEMRTKELKISEENKKAIKEKTGLTFDCFLGSSGQQNFRRVTQYIGFLFKEPEKVDLKIWKKNKDYPEFFEPNRRTKLGREMEEFLRNGLKGSRYDKPLDILGLEPHGRFTFPYVEIVGDIILIYLDNNMNPKDENVIEITRTEFDSLFNQFKIQK